MTTIAKSTTNVVTITAWIDPLVDDNGHDPRSLYAERFWLPVTGPTASWILRRFAHALDTRPEGIDIDLDDLARQMGLSYNIGRSSPFTKALQRLVMFGLAHHTNNGLAVRRRIPTVARRHLNRLPDGLQTEHSIHVESVATLDDFGRAHRIGIAMHNAGDTPTQIERQLVAIGITATIAEAIANNVAELAR